MIAGLAKHEGIPVTPQMIKSTATAVINMAESQLHDPALLSNIQNTAEGMIKDVTGVSVLNCSNPLVPCDEEEEHKQ